MSDDGQHRSGKGRPGQAELPLGAGLRVPAATGSLKGGPTAAPGQRAFRVIRGEGQRKPTTLADRNDVARVLVGAAADLLLRRISPERANELEQRVEKVMNLFDRCDREPILLPILRREIDLLEALVRESEAKRRER